MFRHACGVAAQPILWKIVVRKMTAITRGVSTILHLTKIKYF